jgi:hypothetical protein
MKYLGPVGAGFCRTLVGKSQRQSLTLEIDAGRYYVRAWFKPFAKPYKFSNHGPLCFGALWFGFMIFTSKE